MRLKRWAKWFILEFVILDGFLVTLYLYMLRLIEIGG